MRTALMDWLASAKTLWGFDVLGVKKSVNAAVAVPAEHVVPAVKELVTAALGSGSVKRWHLFGVLGRDTESTVAESKAGLERCR